MRFRAYLLEKTMSTGEAKSIFGIDSIPPEAELKKKYYQLALDNHPDKGGSTEKMQLINAAYEVLKQSVGTGSDTSKFDWEKNRQEYRELGKQIKDVLVSGFNGEKFVDYLNSVTGLKFDFKITDTFPKETDYSPYGAGFSAEFSTADKSTKFMFSIYANITTVKYTDTSKSLTGETSKEISFDLTISTDVFHNNKKHKLAQKNYSFTNDHSFYKDPSKLFPADKVTKIVSGATSQRAFSRRDMYSFLQNKLGADTDKDFAYIPIRDDYKLVIFRSVMMRTPVWSPNGLYLKHRRVDNLIFKSFMETESFALGLEKIVNDAKQVPDDQMVEFLKAELLKLYTEERAKRTEG